MSSINEALGLTPQSRFDDADIAANILSSRQTDLARMISGGKVSTLEEAAAQIGGSQVDNIARMRNAIQLSGVLRIDPIEAWNNYDQISADFNAKMTPKTPDTDAVAMAYERARLFWERNSLYQQIMDLGGGDYVIDLPSPGEMLSQNQTKIAELKKRITEINSILPQIQDDEQRSFLTDVGKWFASTAPSLQGMVTSTLQGATAGMAAGAVIGAAGGPITEIPSAAGGMIGGAGRGFLTGIITAFKAPQYGAAIGAAYDAVVQSEGTVYGDLIEKGAGHDQARLAAKISGALNAPLAISSLSLATKIEPVLANMVQESLTRAKNETIRQFATQRTAAAILAKTATEFTGRVAGQEIIAGAQSLVNDLTFNFGANLQNDLTDQGIELRTAGEISVRAMEAMKENLALAGLMELPISLIQAGRSFKGADKTFKSIERAREIVKDMPGLDSSVKSSFIQDSINEGERLTSFLEKQSSEETRTKAWDEENERPETFYVGNTENGRPLLFRNPEDAAASFEGRKFTGNDLVNAVTERYGRSAGEWMDSVLRKREVLGETAKEQLQNANVSALRELAGSIDGRTLPASILEVADELGLSKSEQKIMAAHIDSDQVLPDGPVSVDKSLIVPIGPIEARSVRLPRINDQIVVKNESGALSAVDPSTGENVATIRYIDDDGVMRITELPDNPSQARELLDSIDGSYVLDVPLEEKEAVLSTDKEWRKAYRDLANLEDQALKEREAVQDIENLPDEEQREITAEALRKAEKIAADREEILSRITSREQAVLKESTSHTIKEIDESAQEVFQANEQVKDRIAQKIIDVAPQITREQADVFTKLMEIRAAAMGMTIEQWERAYLRDVQTGDWLKSNQRGAATIFNNGQAIITLGKEANFSTLIHELGHVIQDQLSEVDQAKLKEAYGVAQWTTKAKEKFARDFEDYFTEGKSFSKELDTLFAKIAYWMREIYKAVRNLIDPNVREVIEKAFGKNGLEIKDSLYQTDYIEPQRARELRDELASLSLDDPRRGQLLNELADIREAHKSEVKEAVERGERVPKEVLQDYSGEAWADDALKNEGGIDTAITDDAELPTDRIDIENAAAAIFGEEESIEAPSETRSRRQANRDFVNSFDDSALDELAGYLKKKADPEFIGFDIPSHVMDVGQPVKDFAFSNNPDLPYRNGKSPRQIAMGHVKRNPNRYREIQAYLRNDIDLIAENNEINRKEPLSQDVDYKAEQIDEKIQKLGINERLERIRELIGVPAHKATVEQIDLTYDAIGKEVSSIRSEYRRVNERLAGLDKKYREARDNYAREKTDRNAEIRDLAKSARHEARRNLNLVVKRLKDKQASIDELRRAKAYKSALLKTIFKPTPKSIDYRYAKLADEIRSVLVEKRNATKEHNKIVKQLYEERASLLKENPDLTLPEIGDGYKKFLDQFTIEELEKAKSEVEALIIAGREVKRMRDADLIRQSERIVSDITNNIRDWYGDIERSAVTGDEKKSLGRGLLVSTLGPQLNLDSIDGGKDFQGPALKAFYNRMSDLIGQAMAMTRKRMEGAQEAAKNINESASGEKITAWNMSKHFKRDGQDIMIGRGRDKHAITYDEAMGIYMGMQNESSANAIRYGNLIPQDIIDYVQANLDQTWKNFGDWLIDHGYGDRYDAIAQVVGDADNVQMGRQYRYSPMLRRDVVGNDLQGELSLEAQQRAGVKKTPADGFKNARINISPIHQTPIRLDAFAVFQSIVPKQEVYISVRMYDKVLNKVIRDSTFRNAVKSSVGGEYLKDLEDWLARSVNPDVFAVRDSADLLIRKIRANGSIAYLGFSLLTIVKQVPGVILYLQDAGFRLFSSFGKALTIKGYFDMNKRMRSLSPEMANRVMDKIMQEARSGALGKVKSSLVKVGFKGLQLLDAVTVTIGWDAVYNRYKAKGFSDAEAAREATNSTNRTQPVGEAKDMSKIMARQDGVSLLTQFGSAMNQIWGMVAHLPPAKRGKAFMRYFIQLTAIIGSGVAMGALGRAGREEEQELLDSILTDGIRNQLIASLPLFGSPVSSAIQGYDSKLPLFAPFTEAIKKGVAGAKKGEDLTDKQLSSMIDSGFEVSALVFGLPYLQIKRAMQAADSQDAGEFIKKLIWGGKQ